MADLDGGFFLVEKGVPGDQQAAGFTNATLQRIGAVDMSVAIYVEPPVGVVLLGEDGIAAWFAYLCGSMSKEALDLGGAIRFEVKIGPAAD